MYLTIEQRIQRLKMRMYKNRQKFDELAAELAAQQHPKVDDPTLERFVLYNCDRLVCKIVRRGGR